MNQKSDEIKQQYSILKGKGLNQREIAKALNVTEQTISRWKDELEPKHYETIIRELLKRLVQMTKDKTTPVQEILKLTTALAATEKAKAYKTKNLN